MAAVDVAIPAAHPEASHGDSGNYLAARGLRSWLLTVDHKRIGVLYLVSVMAAFVLGGVFALLVRAELFTRGRTIMDATTYNRLFTLHGAVMVFLFIIPGIPGSLANFVLPIMLGAKDVAFPRLNLLSWYLYLAGALLAVASIVIGPVDTGWTFYTPYSTQTGGGVIAITAGVFIMGFSSILTGLNFIVTTHKLRAPGLRWKRMPLFVWGIYASGIMQVLATPVLAITLLLLIFERAFGLGVFDPKLGGDPVLFQHFFWFYSHPAVYIMILPGMAIVSEVIACFSRRAIFGYFAVAMSSVGIALISFFVWAHHMFTAGMSEFATMLFSALTFLVAIPSAIKIFNWTATLARGAIWLTTPMLYGLGFIFLFTIGGLTGLFLATLNTDIHLHDTYFVVAHFHYVMMGGTVTGFLGGIVYWWPKITGRMHDERLTKVGFWLFFVGFNLAFLTQFVLGSRGMPRRYYDYLPQFTTLHQLSTVGSFILGAGIVVTGWALVSAIWKGKKAPPNPWGSTGLEWQTTSPPPVHNFDRQPVVTRGPYDFHLCSERELFQGFPEEFPAGTDPDPKERPR